MFRCICVSRRYFLSVFVLMLLDLLDSVCTFDSLRILHHPYIYRYILAVIFEARLTLCLLSIVTYKYPIDHFMLVFGKLLINKLFRTFKTPWFYYIN